MKVKDLSIGDWVNVFNVPKQIEGIRIFKNGDEIVYYDGDNGNFIKSVTPIPLTKEILQKNGFDGDVYLWNNIGDEKTLEYYPFEHRLSLWYGEGKSQEILFKYHCFSVHELQHALKLWGIKKEIVL